MAGVSLPSDITALLHHLGMVMVERNGRDSTEAGDRRRRRRPDTFAGVAAPRPAERGPGQDRVPARRSQRAPSAAWRRGP